MKRALFSQIRNDWKENIWIILELLVVALVIWYISLILIRNYRNLKLPLGADIENVYGATINLLDEKGQNLLFYYPSDLEPVVRDRLTVNLKAMLNRIRNLPMVESVALGNNALPYNLNYSGNIVRYKHHNDTLEIYVNTRIMTPEGVKVLKIQPKNGKRTDHLQTILEKGDLLIGSSLQFDMEGKKYGYDIKDVLNKPLEEPFADFHIGGLIETMRRTHYEPHVNYGTLIVPVPEDTPQILCLNTLMVRVKPGMGKAFENAMSNEPTLLSPTDMALSELRPLSDDRLLTTWDDDVNTRTYITGIILILVIIFLGLLGTFWYRVYLRTPEIAIRKTFGATDSDIFRRLVSEALLLLSVSIAAGVILYVVLRSKLESSILQPYTIYDTWEADMILGGVLTAMAMTWIILIGVGIPAHRAMHIAPAIALKEE